MVHTEKVECRNEASNETWASNSNNPKIHRPSLGSSGRSIDDSHTHTIRDDSSVLVGSPLGLEEFSHLHNNEDSREDAGKANPGQYG